MSVQMQEPRMLTCLFRSKGLWCYVCLLLPTVYWLLLKDFREFFLPINFFLVHTFFLHCLIFWYKIHKKILLKRTSPGVLVLWVQSTVQWMESILLQDSGYLSNILRVKHLCHLPLLLLLPDPGLPAGLPARLEATEKGQDLGLDHMFIS